MNGDLYVRGCEHLSASHYVPIRRDHGIGGVGVGGLRLRGLGVAGPTSAFLCASVPDFNANHTQQLSVLDIFKDTPTTPLRCSAHR